MHIFILQGLLLKPISQRPSCTQGMHSDASAKGQEVKTIEHAEIVGDAIHWQLGRLGNEATLLQVGDNFVRLDLGRNMAAIGPPCLNLDLCGQRRLVGAVDAREILDFALPTCQGY